MQTRTRASNRGGDGPGAKQTRKRLDPAARAGHILQMALQLFAERHYSRVTMRDIAEACDINVALIYYSYENKDALLRRALGHAIAELQAGYDVGLHLDPARQLTTWLRMHVPIAPMLVRMAKIMADYAASNLRDPHTDRLIQDFYRQEQDFLEACLARGVAQGIFRAVDVEQTARALSLQLDGIFYASQARGDTRIMRDIENLCGIVASPALAAVKTKGRR
jgi:AcrR family transcriptional regulator